MNWLGTCWAALSLMTRAEKIGAIIIVGVMMLAGLVESVVVAMVLPIVYLLVEPDRLAHTLIGHAIITTTGSSSLGELFPVLAAGLVILVLASSTLTFTARWANEVHSARCRDRMASEVLGAILDAPYIWLAQRNITVLARHVTEDVRAWRKECIHAVLMALQAMIMIAAPAGVAIAIAPARGLLALLAVGTIAALVVIVFRNHIRSVSNDVKFYGDAARKTLMQVLGASREVKVSGAGPYFVGTFGRFNAELNAIEVRLRRLGSIPGTMITLLGQVGFLAVAVLLWQSGMTGSEIVAQIALIGVVVSRVVPAFNWLASQIATIFRSLPYVQSMISLREELAAIKKPASAAQISPEWRALTLRDVSMVYPTDDRRRLDAVSMTLQRGKSYGLVGRSGAGKSTLVNIMLGLIVPTSGEVSIDTHPLADMIEGWQRRVGYVPQEPFILDSTIRDNVMFGLPFDEARLREAVAAAHLGEVVEGLPEGYDTHIGERGRLLSGGQAQRVALARALYRRPDVLILDEATSALDHITELAVQEAVAASGAMVLTISHRVSSLKRCDRIFVMEAGRVVDQGAFADLMLRSDLFRSLAAQHSKLAAVQARS